MTTTMTKIKCDPDAAGLPWPTTSISPPIASTAPTTQLSLPDLVRAAEAIQRAEEHARRSRISNKSWDEAMRGYSPGLYPPGRVVEDSKKDAALKTALEMVDKLQRENAELRQKLKDAKSTANGPEPFDDAMWRRVMRYG